MIVYERQPFWQPQLQWQFVGQQVSVQGCRTTRDLSGQLLRGARAVVVADLAAGPADVLLWLGRAVQERIDPFVVVIAPDRMASLEWHVRELGAAVFAGEFIGSGRVAHLCRRYWSAEDR